MQNNVKRVVFCDLGDVVALLRAEEWLVKLRALSLWENDDLYTAAFKRASDIWGLFQRGRIEKTALFSLLYRDLLHIKPISELEFLSFYLSIFKGPNSKMIANLREMRVRGYALALFSDIDPERWLFMWATQNSLCNLTVFHDYLLSFKLEGLKSEISTWQRAFNKMSVLPRNAFFIDDLKKNTRVANAAGIPADQILLYRADRHDEEAMPFFRRHELA